METQELNIFISHRHDDNAFAEIFKRTFRSWGFPHVFEASDPKNGILVGASIDASIKQQLTNCHLLLHIFTHSDENWEWVAREIGIAEMQPMQPRIVTFQIFKDEPRIRQDALRVRLNEKEIEHFVRNVFCKDQFFTGSGPVWPAPEKEGPEKQAHEKYLKTQARELYQALQDAARKAASKQETKALMPIENKEELKVFVSCRDIDLKIGETVKKRIESWGLNVKMSPVGSAGAYDGKLESEINRFLWQSHLVILIFTRAASDWGRCIYEVGIANEETVPTHMAIFQVLEDNPSNALAWMPGETIDMKKEEDVNQFITDLFYKPNFFPGFKAILSDKPLENLSKKEKMEKRGWESFVREEGKALFEDLEQQRDCAGEGQGSELNEVETRWGYFSLSLSAETFKECENLKKNNDEEEIFETLKASLKVAKAEKWGLNHFGYTNTDEALNDPDGLSLNQLFHTWEEAVGDKDSNREWADELVREIWAFRTGKGGFELSWKPFLSAHPQIPGTYPFYPVVTHVEKFQDNSRIYQICTFGIPNPQQVAPSDSTEPKSTLSESTRPIDDVELNQSELVKVAKGRALAS